MYESTRLRLCILYRANLFVLRYISWHRVEAYVPSSKIFLYPLLAKGVTSHLSINKQVQCTLFTSTTGWNAQPAETVNSRASR